MRFPPSFRQSPAPFAHPRPPERPFSVPDSDRALPACLVQAPKDSVGRHSVDFLHLLFFAEVRREGQSASLIFIDFFLAEWVEDQRHPPKGWGDTPHSSAFHIKLIPPFLYADDFLLTAILFMYVYLTPKSWPKHVFPCRVFFLTAI